MLLHCSLTLATFIELAVTVRLPLHAGPCIDKSEHPLVEVLYNEAATIDCMLMTGCAAAEVWWVRPNGAVVREQTLHLEAPHTPGIYSCFARNDNGDDRYDVTLDIRGKYFMFIINIMYITAVSDK